MSDFLAHVLELLRPLGGVSARRMFSGYGLFRNGKMFAIVVNDELYFKVTEKTQPEFKARGLEPFRYKRQGKMVALSYYAAPAECLDDGRIMTEWAGKAG